MQCLLTLFLPVVLQSCYHEDEVYSCNPEVNDWVKENKAQIQTLTRSQWQELDYNVSQASYIAFTPTQKIVFWKEKFAEVKTLNWTINELAHIQEAENFAMSNPQYFRDGKLTDEELDEIEVFFIKWLKQGNRDFGWTKQIAMAIVGTGYKMTDTTGSISLPKRRNTPMAYSTMSTATESTCNCNISSLLTCVANPAGSGCESSNCKEVSYGCGYLLLQACNGRCEEIKPTK